MSQAQHITTHATRTVDVAVLGAGTAGLAAYRAAVATTPNVVLVESGPHGTTCARVGCMPSKLLIAAAEAAHDARAAGPFGVHADVRVDGREVMDRVRRERDRFVGFVVDGVSRLPEAHLLRGRAQFLGPGVLAVGETRIEARAVVVATGSEPVVPPVFEPVRDRVVVNDDVFAWHDLPGSVAVFGAGVIGIELGQALHRLGVRTRIFGRSGTLGPLTDPVVRAAALRALADELPIDLDAQVLSIAPVPDGAQVTFRAKDGDVRVETFEAVLVAAGRRPRLRGLGLELAGVAVEPRTGGVRVDPRTLLAAGTNVFVAGDANGEVPLLHEAADEGKIAGDNAARFPDVRAGHRRSPLAITFSDPQLATVGSRWAELVLARGEDGIVTGAVDFGDQGRSRVMLRNKGALRVYADPESGRFLGAELAGPRAEHLAHLLAWAHQQGLGIGEMLAMPFYHPVVEEGLRTALREAHASLARPARRAD
jgi:dihydrolipoamide dehydrogenase